MHFRKFILCSASAMVVSLLAAQLPTPVEVSVVEVASGLSQPTGIYDCGDGRHFVLEKDAGDIEILDENFAYVGKFLDLTGLISTGGERGLLGMAFHPDYANNGYFYVNYTDTGGDTKVVRYSVDPGDPNLADPNSALEIIFIEQDYSNHNGGHIAFGPDGYLYIGMGDGGSANDPQNRAQDGQSLLGKMLRIDVDNPANGENYGIPADNPFIGNADFLDEIWTYGLRNPWKFSFDSETGDLWIGDVGQNNYEEIILELADYPGGANYGWKCYEGFHVNPNIVPCDLAEEEVVFPLEEYLHGGVYGFCSITGGVRYRGTEFPGLYGHYVFTDYCNGRLWSMYQDQQGVWQNGIIRNSPTFGIVMFYENPQGQLFYAHINNGAIYKIVEDCGAWNPVASGNGEGSLVASANEGYEGVNYWWYLDGVEIPGANASMYIPVASGSYYCVVENSEGCSRTTNSIEWLVASGIPGCTYPAASNYSPEAQVDDGSCVFNLENTCPADINDDGLVNSNDLLDFLAAFGTVCE